MFKKRVLPIFLIFMMVFMAVPVYANSTVERLTEISKTGSYREGSRWGGGACWKFVNAVSTKIFGVTIPLGPNGYSLDGVGSNSNWVTIGTTNGNNDQVKALLQQAQAGDIIQYCSDVVKSQHTAMVYAKSDWGISIYDHTESYGVKIRSSAWSSVFSWNGGNGLGDFEGSRYGLSLYRCTKNSTNSSGGTYTPPTNNQPSQPTISTPVTNKVNFSNIKASNISETNAKLSASVSYSGTRPSEVGIYLGNSTGSMRKVGSDKINHSKNPFDMWYDLNKHGVTLSAGTQYYYKMYAIVDGKEFTSKTKNFWTSLTISVNSGSEKKNPDPVGMPAVSVDGSTVSASWNSVANATSYDVYLVQEPWGWGDIKYRGSTQGTSYTFTNVRNGAYAAFVIARPNKDTVQSEWSSFNVNVASTSTADFYNINASNVSRTNAQLNASISYSGNHPSEVGVYFGNSTDSMRKVGSDAINHNKNPFDMWYSLNKYGVTLSAGTTYYYKMYAIMDGREVTSNVQSFTTPAQVNSNLVTARVSGTPGGLAINSQPNQYTKIGRMDEGVYCTIDLSRTSGNWYYVTYNGVSGYAYNRYLVIQ